MSEFITNSDNSQIPADLDHYAILKERTNKKRSELKEIDTSKTVGLFELETANEAILGALNLPDPKYLYDVLIQEKELVILFADTGVGKTVYAMQSAIHIAGNGHKVLFLDLELSKKQFQKRYTSEEGEPFLMPDTLYRVGYSRLREIPSDRSYTDFFFDSLKKLIDQTGAQVVYVDNLTKLAAGDTDTAKATIPILEGLNSLKDEYDLTIIAIEHNKKVDTTRQIHLNDLQGSKMKSNLVDSVFTIGKSTKDKNLRYVKQVKVRDGELRYDTDNVMICEISKANGFLGFTTIGYGSEFEHLKQLTEGDNQSLESQVLELHQKSMSLRDIGARLGITHMKVQRILNKM